MRLRSFVLRLYVPQQERFSKTGKILIALAIGLAVIVLFALPARAETFTVTVNVKDNNGNNLSTAYVVIQRCKKTSTTNSCNLPTSTSASAWTNTIQSDYTNGSGNTVAFTVQTDYQYRIVAAKDNYSCPQGGNGCPQIVWRQNPQNITKNIVLDAPTNQTTDVCPQRSLNAEDQRKVIEKGLESANLSFVKTQEPKWLKYYDADYHTWNFALTMTPGAPLPNQALGFHEHIFKLDTRAAYSGYTKPEIQNAATANPGSWWIMGEEPAGRLVPPGNIDTAAAAYAQWYHEKSQWILEADSSAKLIFGYLAQWVPPSGPPFNDQGIYDPTEFTRRVFAEWKNHSNWCPEPPMDAIHFNFTPYVTYIDTPEVNGTPTMAHSVSVANTEKDNPQYLYDQISRYRDLLYDGSGYAWLANERLSIGTGQQWDVLFPPGTPTPPGNPVTVEANRYIQAAMGTLLDPNPNKYGYLLFLMNYAGNSEDPSQGSNLQVAACTQNSCTPNPDDSNAPYGSLFANMVYRNAGWEKGNLANWTQENGAATPISNFAVIDSNWTFTTNIQVASQHFVELIDNAGYCVTNGCWLRSERTPLASAAQDAATWYSEIDYRVVNGTGTLRLRVNFFDDAGSSTGSGTCSTTYNEAVSAWQHLKCSSAALPSGSTQARISIKIEPDSSSASNKVRIDNASAQFEAP